MFKKEEHDILLQKLIYQESFVCLEIALRYRRANLIHGFNAPYLSWLGRPEGSYLKLRLP